MSPDSPPVVAAFTSRSSPTTDDPIPHGLPLRFSNLSIPTPGGSRGNEALVGTLGSSVVDVVTLGPLRRALDKRGMRQEEFMVVGAEGIVHQGELLLIVGPPSSNASTLLRALSSPSDLPISDTSLLDYGLLPPSAVKRPSLFPPTPENAGILRSQVVHMNDHDVHFATLSLRSSMMPGSLAKTPSLRARLGGMTRREWAESRLTRLVDAVGLSHAMGTKVGSPLVRGLSGGERKRASIVEALLTRASVLCLDAPTSGLDSSTALSLLSFLRAWARDGKRSLVATAPHIADPLYAQFDKVLVLSSTGGQIFFGKTADAQLYFEQLGLGFHRRVEAGEGIAEFLVGCVEGRRNDVELEEAWLKSSNRKALALEMKEYERIYPFATCAGPLIDALKKEKSRATSRHYTVSFLYQVAVLTRRQYALVYSELPGYVTKTIVNLLLSITVGSLFFRLPPTSSAAFTRGSLLLLSTMFNAYLSLAELGKAIEGRDIVRRQGDWGFFGSSALALARVAGDLPLIFAQCLLFGTVTYVLAGLQPSLDHFCIYIVFIYATALNLSSMFRMFAAFSPGFEEAIRFCGICLNILVIFAGYFIPTPSMRAGLKWIHYVVDPISYSYEAVLANEFHNLILTCSPSDIVPSGPSYTDSSYQTCLLPGSTPRSLIVSGDAYLATAYDFHYDKIWYNLGIMALQAVVFLIIGVVATEFLHFAPGGTKRIWARTKRVKRRLARLQWYKRDELETGEASFSLAPLLEDSGASSAFGDEVGEAVAQVEGSVLVWRNLCLWVDTGSETRRLLDHVEGYIKPGRVCALMGASGAGKSTLLNVLAGRTIGVVRGTVLVDGVKPNKEFYRTTGYCQQFDLHDDRSTIREALEFSALLRQDASIPREEKLAYVDVVLDLLDLTHIQDAIIGTPSAGLNPEQRKRTTIAVEVVSRPRLLYLDEPTTGLDTKSALRVVQLLRRLARTGLAIICTIHQPSSETFDVFDDLLLLQRGGKQVYFGPREAAVGYFTETGSTNEHVNPADFLLDVAGAGIDTPDDELVRTADLDVLSTRWKASNAYRALQSELEILSSPDSFDSRAKASAASIWTQCVELTKRVSRHYWRDPSFSYTKLFTSTVVPLVVGLSFFQVGRESTLVSFQNRMFSVFLLLFVPVVWLNVLIFKIFKLRGLWEARERPSCIYGRTAFVTSLLVSEVPYSLVCATAYFTLWYFLVGLPMRASTMFFAFLLVQIFFLFQSTWALWIVALSQEIGTIANLLPFFLVSMEAFNGSLMPYDQMPSYWRWLYHISPFQHYIRSMLGALLHNATVQCGALELVSFDTPAGLTCVKYAAEYLSSHAGYLVNPLSTSTCEFCKASTGDDYLATLNISFDDRWRSLGVLAGYTLSNVVLAYVLFFFPPRLPAPTRWRGRTEVRAELIADEEYEREVAEILAEGTRGPFA